MFNFKLKENQTNLKTEIIAGTTTFLTMAYILFVNPDILSITGMEKGALKRGEWRELNDKELKALKRSVHLK